MLCYYTAPPFSSSNLFIIDLNLIQNCSLAPLVKKMSEARVAEMIAQLCVKLLNAKDQHRDTASIALKTVVAEVSTQSLAQSILSILSPELIKGITGPVSSSFCLKTAFLFGGWPPHASIQD